MTGVRCRFDDLGLGDCTGLELRDLRGQIVALRPNDVPDAIAEVAEATRDGLFAAGFVAYEAAPGFDRALKVRTRSPFDPLWGMPLAWFGLFGNARRASPVLPLPAPALVWDWEMTEEGYARAVSAVRGRIAQGWTYQANLTTFLHARGPMDPRALYAHLSVAQGGRHNAYIETPDWAIVSASPESFFTLDDGLVTTRPMKGTARRGRDPGEDDGLARGLATSVKEQAENVMIVDLIRNDLGRIAEIGGVAVPDMLRIEQYPTLWQMTSTVTARVPTSVGVAEIFEALFPCGSVTGAPKVATMALIAAIEPRPRGVYCGAVGYVAPRDHHPQARFSVAIRTATVSGGCYAEFGVGSGLTWDSTASGEWEELHTKAAILERTRS